MIKKFRTYIMQEPWDEWLIRQEDIIDAVCITVVALVALFFVPFCVGILAR